MELNQFYHIGPRYFYSQIVGNVSIFKYQFMAVNIIEWKKGIVVPLKTENPFSIFSINICLWLDSVNCIKVLGKHKFIVFYERFPNNTLH